MLMDKLVLKGGNALDIVHKLGTRTSFDIDLSMPGDFDDLADIQERIFRACKTALIRLALWSFDRHFIKKPEVEREGQDPRWGGYRVEFNVIEN
jgi:Nucleotidyl transferase AbiEii toxin, Type IV TA system